MNVAVLDLLVSSSAYSSATYWRCSSSLMLGRVSGRPRENDDRERAEALGAALMAAAAALARARARDSRTEEPRRGTGAGRDPCALLALLRGLEFTSLALVSPAIPVALPAATPPGDGWAARPPWGSLGALALPPDETEFTGTR